MTKHELRNYRHIVKRIKALQAEREELINLVRPLDGMPHGHGVSDPTASVGAKLADIAAEIDDEIRCLNDERTRIMAVLSQLPKEERNIMVDVYILGLTWPQAAENAGYSERQIHRIHSKILEEIK
ncbi:MAG: sigma factor-like helix-turn-helix DNA-binding protein [Bacillota bacterium]|jgi:DNA-directed RNA polymerase specialized sigma subunit